MKMITEKFLVAACGLLLTLGHASAMDASTAEDLVKKTGCLDGKTVDQVLQQKISSSQRDLGWQVFDDEGRKAVEHSVLVSKSMQLRYRWELDEQGHVQASSDRAKSLCTAG